VDLVRCTKCYYYCFLAQSFQAVVQENISQDYGPALKNLCDLFIIHFIHQQSDLLYELLSSSPSPSPSSPSTTTLSRILRQAKKEVCGQLRRDAVGLVDAFGFPDFFLRSPLGRYDGNVYENYLATVSSSPYQHSRAPYWDQLIKPLLL